MYHKNHKKWKIRILYIAGLILLFVALLYLFQEDRSLSPPEKAIQDMVVGIGKFVINPFAIKSQADEDNKQLIEGINDTLKKENAELKDLLELKQLLTDYEVINATVISRNPDYWFQNLTIDKGQNDHVEEDMIVITKKGLLGKISKVSYTTSEVKLITSADVNYKVSVEIEREEGNIPALLEGYDPIEGLAIVTGIDNYTEIAGGEEVITSGLGGLFPRGIYVGQVQRVENEKYDISKRLKVKMLQNFNDVHYVSILRRK